MMKSMIVWKCFIVFGYMLQPVYTGATNTSKACYGAPGLSCTQHDIICSSTQKIAISDAYYTDNNKCKYTGLSSCTVNQDSWTENGYHRFNNTELVSLYNNCSTEIRCVYRAPRRSPALAFSVVKYQCIKKGELLNTSGGVAEGLSEVSLIHRENRMPNSTMETINYMCSLKSDVAATSISLYALDARLGRGTPGQCFSKLSVLLENEISMTNCSSDFQLFERLNVTAELPISLNFVDFPRSSSALIWLLINASDPFNVTCEPVTGAETSSKGSSRSTTDTTPTATIRDYTQSTTESSGITTTNHTVLTDKDTHTSESSRIATTNNTVLTENDTHKTDDTGAIIGGVVAIVVAILVVTLVSVRLIRNRRAKGEGKEKTASSPLDVQPDMAYSLAGKIPQNNYHEIQDLKTQSGNYDYATADGMQNANTYFILEQAEKQNAKQFSKASTTESDYDHIGEKPSPQTSDYDTTASVLQSAHTGGTIGEDNYGYNLFHKKTNPQIHQNDYDTAASATKAVAQLTRTDRNTDDDDYDHFPRVTNHPETVSSPYDTASGMAVKSDYSIAGPMK